MSIIKLASIKLPKAIWNIASSEGKQIAEHEFNRLAGRGYDTGKSIAIALSKAKNAGHSVKQIAEKVEPLKTKLVAVQPSLFKDFK